MKTFETDYMTRNLCNFATTVMTLIFVKLKNNAELAGLRMEC